MANDPSIRVGDIVYITEEGYALGKVGVVGSETLTAIENDRVTYRVPVRFPKFVADRWFFHYEVHPASEQQRKKYFLEILKRGE